MSHTTAIEALKGYLVALGGHVVKRRFCPIEEETWTDQPFGVNFGKRGQTIVPSDVVDMIAEELNKPIVHLEHDAEMDQFLAGVVGLIEATRDEQQSIWEHWAKNGNKSWEQVNPGLLPTIGGLAGMPICLCLSKVKVNGQVVLFYHATSQVVDHRVVDQWIKAQMPASARDKHGVLNKTDATNAHIVLGRL